MDVLIVFLLVLCIYYLQRRYLLPSFTHNISSVTENYIDILFIIHLLFFGVYFLYTFTSRSDSGEYYRLSVESQTWGELFVSGTPFVKFVCYPFSHVLGLSFNSVMLIFAFLGFEGMLFFYLAARENIQQLPLVWGGMTILEILFILPNSHFWSGSLGKGSLMTLGIGLTFYGLSRFNRRLHLLLIGAFIVYMVRPHLLLAIVIGVGLGVLFTQKGIKWYFRLPLIIFSALTIFIISDNVVEFTGMESLNVFDSKSLDHRVEQLGHGGSGVDVAHYSEAFKLFTFLFRPLFVDSPSLLGLITSFENFFLLFLSFRFIVNFPLFWKKSNGFHKAAFFTFLLAAISLAQISGNLGIAIRQKAQIFPLLFLFFAFSFSLSYKQK